MIKYIQKIFRAAALLTLGALAATACDKTIKVTVKRGLTNAF